MSRVESGSGCSFLDLDFDLYLHNYKDPMEGNGGVVELLESLSPIHNLGIVTHKKSGKHFCFPVQHNENDYLDLSFSSDS